MLGDKIIESSTCHIVEHRFPREIFVFPYFHTENTSEKFFPFISHKIRMSKRNFKKDFAKFKESVSRKRRKEDTTSKSDMEYITVQRLSSHVEG